MAGTAHRVALLVVCVANAAATPVSCASVAFSEKVVTTLAGGARAVSLGKWQIPLSSGHCNRYPSSSL